MRGILIVLGLLVALAGCRSAGGPSVKPLPIVHSGETGPLRLAIIGMTHGHVEGPLWQARDRDDLEIVGIWEPDRAVYEKFAQKYGLPDELYFEDLGDMLESARPEAASVMTPISDHVMAVEACAPRGVHLLIEKPLAFTNRDARRIASLARAHGVLALTNYETSWYASVREAKRLVDSGETAPVRRMVFRHGHKGPAEIGCSPEFLAWLTDPEQNGGGAIVDFGCYGAILASWIIGDRPETVRAEARTLKPAMYPNVDDDATIVLGYEGATAVIQASWAWTHDNKEMDLHTESGSVHCEKWDQMGVREPDRPLERMSAPGRPDHLRDEWTYLRHAVRGECEIDPLSGLELNLIAVEILDAARESARTGRAVRLDR